MGLKTVAQEAISVTITATIATGIGDGATGANPRRTVIILTAPAANTDVIYFGTLPTMTLTALNGHQLSAGQQLVLDGAPVDPFIFLAASGTQSVIVSEYEG